jgi:predicted amidohydrolase YtcJ
LLITGAEVDGVAPLDVRLVDGRIAEIGGGLSRTVGEPVHHAAGGALLPGLHDHHLHLFALAAAETSVRCGPPEVRDPDTLARVLAGAPATDGWIRGVGYHESVAGELDRARLDSLVPDRPLRIQHRSGAMWVVNSLGARRIGLDGLRPRAGVEHDAEGRATGRLFRLDAWLRQRLDPAEPPSLASVSRRLARFGVTGVTDATHDNSRSELDAFVAAVHRGELLQRLVVMGTRELPRPTHVGVERGALKILLDEHDLPHFDALQRTVEDAHEQDRSVAIHCVTRAELVLAAAALAAAGSRIGDRIEHAAVAPPELIALLADLPVTVVTQPGFIRERGDAYLVDVAPADRPWLYRGRGFLDAAIPLGAGTDAPFGELDPWQAMQAAVDRRTEAGVALGPEEGIAPERALALFTSHPSAPGGPPRSIGVGAPADLCLLDRPWARARSKLSSALVAATIRDGSIVWQPE